MIDPIKILQKYFDPDSKAYHFLVEHGKSVYKKAKKIANNLNEPVDLTYLEQAAMLHDIGICYCKIPGLGINGTHPYIMHGVLGAQILQEEGLGYLASICERHVGVGFTKEEIKSKNLPLPRRDMYPKTIEEELICYADKFFSKRKEYLKTPKDLKSIKDGLRRFGEDKVEKFNKLHEKFSSFT